MNSAATPAWVKDNVFTRLLERVGQMNAMEGLPAGKTIEQMGNVRLAIPPDVDIKGNEIRSEEESRRTNYVPPPLGAEEYTPGPPSYVPPPPHVPLPLPERDENGMTEEELQPMPRVPVAGLDNLEDLIPGKYRRPEAPQQAVIPSQVSRPRGRANKMPDFSHVQGFDLERGMCIVDGSDYPIDPASLAHMKKFAVDLVMRHVVEELAKAYTTFGLTPGEIAAHGNAKVPPMQKGERGDDGQLRDGQRETTEPVQSVPSGTESAVAAGEPGETQGIEPAASEEISIAGFSDSEGAEGEARVQ